MQQYGLSQTLRGWRYSDAVLTRFAPTTLGLPAHFPAYPNALLCCVRLVG